MSTHLPLLEDIWTDEILPLLTPAEALRLGSANKAFYNLICKGPASELIWKRRIKTDLRFPIASTARQSGWLELYRKIRKPHVYLWGEAKNSRLAIERGDPRVQLLSRSGGLPMPARINLGVPIVDLVAGGWSFHALTVDGKVYHWGQLDGMVFAPFRAAASSTPDTGHPGCNRRQPTLLRPEIPPIQRILSGRDQVLALDENNHLWTWANWAEAALITSSWISSSDYHIQDIAAGWQFSAVLTISKRTRSQEIHVFWQKFLSPTERDHSLSSNVRGLQGKKGCYTFQPQSVKLPELRAPTSISPKQPLEKIDKIAAGDNFLVAITSEGRVYKLDVSPPPRTPAHAQQQQENDPDEANEADEGEDGRLTAPQLAELESLFASQRRTWEYLPRFSESQYWENNASGNTRINHISASFRTFFAIGESVVLQGSNETTADSGPTVKPELQNRGVIRVECGDYHYGALTSSGELLTFGEYSNGALGHGLDNNRLPETSRTNNRALAIPTKVEFSDPFDSNSVSDEYCFNIAMAGWASSALTVDLREGEGFEDTDSEKEKRSGNSGPASSPDHAAEQGAPRSVDENPQPLQTIEEMTGAIRGGIRGRNTLPFRIGFAGRGAFRGGLGRRGNGPATE